MKILYVTTVSITMGFFPEHIKMLQEQGHRVELACNMDEPVPQKVAVLGCKEHHIPFSRSPLSGENLKGFRELKKLVRENHYDVVHCHTPIAAAMTRLACRKLRKQGLKVIYTAHGFHFYTGAPLMNWLVYYPVEWLCAHWTDVLLTMNSEDYKRAKKRMKAKRVEYVPGVGIDLSKFSATQISRAAKRGELGIPEDAVLLLSVGELNENKNHETVIRAIAEMDAYYMIAGEGTLRERMQSVIDEPGIAERVKLLGFRSDVIQLYAAADVFVFPSFREGLSVALMEAMAMGKAVVCSDIRGNRDLIEEGKGGLRCRPDDADGFARAIQTLCGDGALREAMGEHNREAVQAFSKETVLEKMREVYEM